MSAQHIVHPSQIEAELLKIQDIDPTQRMRASLFNLIVFNQLSQRTDYIRGIVQKIIDTFPCRVLFISHDPDPSSRYLKTAVSVVASGIGGTAICDDIDIGVAGAEWERVPYVVLPHLLPDLPVYLLWAENPSAAHPLFDPLSKMAERVIFDSESADDLSGFSQTLLALKNQKNRDVADLNWARMDGWRNLLACTFDSAERIEDLRQIDRLTITFNARKTQHFCHLKIQAMYLLAFLSSRLKWNYTGVEKDASRLLFSFERPRASIESRNEPDLPPGSVLSLDIHTYQNSHYEFTRHRDKPHQVIVKITTHDRCELPFQYMLPKTPMGQSLVREIFLKGTNPFFLQMLHQLIILDQNNIC
jgi:glucose-6-phosphate dehydrogenase assembly protein OpcA